MSKMNIRWMDDQVGCLSSGSGCLIEKNIDYRGNGMGSHAKVENQDACVKLSKSRKGALFWTYQDSTKRCFPKVNKNGRMFMAGVVSGNNECGKVGKLDIPASVENIKCKKYF